MASKRSPQTAAKRNREQAVREKRIAKAERRAARKAEPQETSDTTDAPDAVEAPELPEPSEGPTSTQGEDAPA
jgi:hypothetical protein